MRHLKKFTIILKKSSFENLQASKEGKFQFSRKTCTYLKKIIQNKTLKTTNLVKTYTKFLRFY